MSDSATSNFPKMGDPTASVVNMSGQRSPYMRYADKQGFGKNDNPADSARAHRGATEIRGANGPACKIVTTISYPNSPEASQTLRNVKRVQGPYSFELARAQAANSQGV